MLAFYGSSIDVRDGRLEVPGGAPAAPVWEKLVDASPEAPGPFIRNLLGKDDGKLLAYLHTLFHLPVEKQRFLTRTPQRLTAFYRAFPFAERHALERQTLLRNNTHFFDLLRELPLDPDGSIAFPGGEEIWMVANGTSGTAEQIAKMIERAGKRVAPEVEDKILLDLLGRDYEVDNVVHNQTENFLAVVRLQNHRTTPMDAATALTLSQNYGRYHALYAYFSSLPPMNAPEFARFFKAVQAVDRIGAERRDPVLGEFHGIISLLVVLAEVRGITDEEAISILLPFCDAFARARVPQDFAVAAINTLQQIVDATPGELSETADARLLNALAQPGDARMFRAAQQVWNVDRFNWKKRRISGVLSAQTITPIQVLLDVYDSAQALSAKADVPSSFARLEATAGKLLEVTPRPEDQLSDKDLEQLIQGRPREIAKIIADLKKETAKKQSKAIPRLVNDLVEELIPYIKVSLIAWTYAYHSAPTDLVIAEDRYFIRRHTFLLPNREVWEETHVRSLNFRSGIFLSGGLAQIAIAAGEWGLSSTESTENIRSDNSFEFAARAQLAAMRTIPWAQLNAETLHLAGLQLRVAREILAKAAEDPSLRALIADRLVGRVGNFRRLSVNEALSQNDPTGAIELLSSSDLFLLVEAIKNELITLNLHSPLVDEFHNQKDAPAWRQVDYLGGFHLLSNGCVHPHLLALAPYEEFERITQSQLMPERLSDVMLNVAEAADREGIPTDALAILAEPILRSIAARITMVDTDDWLAVIQDMKSIELSKLLPALDKSIQP